MCVHECSRTAIFAVSPNTAAAMASLFLKDCLPYKSCTSTTVMHRRPDIKNCIETWLHRWTQHIRHLCFERVNGEQMIFGTGVLLHLMRQCCRQPYHVILLAVWARPINVTLRKTLHLAIHGQKDKDGRRGLSGTQLHQLRSATYTSVEATSCC